MSDSVNTPLISHDFQGVAIQQRAEDGYLNATAMCKAAGKRWPDYIRLDTTVAFLEALASDVQICTSQLVVSKRGNSKAFAQGTWVHPYVAINLAQWLSPEFAVQVSKWVFQWLGGAADHNREHPRAPDHSMTQALTLVSLALEVWGKQAAQDIWNRVGLPPIDPAHAAAANEDSAERKEPRPDSDEGRVLDYIRRAGPDGVARRDATRRFRAIRAVDLDDILEDLARRGLIRRSAQATSGRPMVVLTAA